jgi:hypothetical protein
LEGVLAVAGLERWAGMVLGGEESGLRGWDGGKEMAGGGEVWWMWWWLGKSGLGEARYRRSRLNM